MGARQLFKGRGDGEPGGSVGTREMSRMRRLRLLSTTKQPPGSYYAAEYSILLDTYRVQHLSHTFESFDRGIIKLLDSAVGFLSLLPQHRLQFCKRHNYLDSGNPSSLDLES
jgi:hypothetical protein